MTITTEVTEVTYTGNGSTTVWAFSFPIRAKSELAVSIELISTGAETPVAQAAFDVVFNTDKTGTITYPLSGSPLSSLFKIHIRQDVEFVQETEIRNQRRFLSEDIEDGFDNVVMQTRQLKRYTDDLYNRVSEIALGAGTDYDIYGEFLQNFHFYNPMEARFGAYGDGVTDDRFAVQAALNAIAAAGRGVLYLNHPHLCSAGLTYTSNSPLIVWSPSPYAGRLIANFATGTLLDISLGTYGTAASPIIDGLGFSKTAGAGVGGTALSISYSTLSSGASRGAEIRNCFVTRPNGVDHFEYGFDITRCPHTTIDSNFLQASGGITSSKIGAGIRVNTWCNGLTVSNNKVRGFSAALESTDVTVPSDEVFQAEGYKVVANTFSNCDYGVKAAINDTEVAWLIQNNAFDIAQYGVWMRNILRPIILGNLFGWNGRHKDHCDIMLQRDDGEEADRVSRTVQAIVSNNRAFRQGNVSMTVAAITRGSSTVIEYAAVTTSRSITAMSATDPMVVTYSGGDAFAEDDMVQLTGIAGDLGTALNGDFYRIINVDTGANTFELSGVDGTVLPAYTGGGTATLENETGSIADGDVLFLSGIVGTTQLNRTPIIVADLDSVAKTFTAKNYYTGTDIDSSAYTAYSSGGVISRYGRFLEIRGGADVIAHDNHILRRNVGCHLWANTRDITWSRNVLINEDGSAYSQVLNASSNGTTLELYDPSLSFATRTEAVTAIAQGWVPINGSVYTIGGLMYRGQTAATAISDLPGLVPDGKAYPEHWGAPANGTGNDSTAINAGLAAGYVINLFADKTYRLNSQITIPSDRLGIEGNGARVIISGATGHFTNDVRANRYASNAVPIVATGRAGPFLRNCRIEYEWAEYRHVRALRWTDCTDIDISGNEFKNFVRGAVVSLSGCVGGKVRSNWIHHCYTNSKFLADGVTTATGGDVQVTAISADDDGTNGSADLDISGNLIEWITVGNAVLLEQGYQADGINIQGSGNHATGKTSRRLKIVNNTVRYTGDGIDCFGRDCIITGNQIEWCFNTGVKLVHGASFNRVAGNNINECGRSGVLLSGSTSVPSAFGDNEILNNTIQNVNRAYGDDGSTPLVWMGADGNAVYTPGTPGHTYWTNVFNFPTGSKSAGVRIDVPTSGSPYHITRTRIAGNTMRLGGNADFAIFCETGAGQPATVHHVFPDNIMSGYLAKYQDEGNRLYIYPGHRHRMRQIAAHTLDNTTSAQPAFDVPSNAGEFNAAAGTRYRFRCQIQMSNLSSSSGDVSFGFGGTATYTRAAFATISKKGAGTGNGILREHNTTTPTPVAMMAASTSTVAIITAEGTLTVNTAGTIVPQVALGVATGSATVNQESFFEIWEDDHPRPVSGDFA